MTTISHLPQIVLPCRTAGLYETPGALFNTGASDFSDLSDLAVAAYAAISDFSDLSDFSQHMTWLPLTMVHGAGICWQKSEKSEKSEIAIHAAALKSEQVGKSEIAVGAPMSKSTKSNKSAIGASSSQARHQPEWVLSTRETCSIFQFFCRTRHELDADVFKVAV